MSKQTDEEPGDVPIAKLAWEGDSREILRGFPKQISFDIWLLQLGERPRDSRPMSSIGKGVFELRQRDDHGWYRIVYLSKVGDTVHMLHSFTKKSAKTSRNDLGIARQRLRAVQERLRDWRTHEGK